MRLRLAALALLTANCVISSRIALPNTPEAKRCGRACDRQYNACRDSPRGLLGPSYYGMTCEHQHENCMEECRETALKRRDEQRKQQPQQVDVPTTL